MAEHKFNKAEYETRQAEKSNLKADTAKKTTISSLADRIMEIEKFLGLR